jgi:hypothetical protein
MLNEIKTSISKIDLMKILVGVFAMTIYFLIVRSLIQRSLPVDNREPLIHVLGTLDGVISMLVGYYFGSSKGSQEKSEIIKKQHEKLHP